MDPKGGPPPPRTGGSFLGDTYLWSQSRGHLQQVLTTLEAELDTGLQIHPTKTAILYRLYSKPEGGGAFKIGGSEVPCPPHKTHISALGSPITFGEPTTVIIAEMVRRGRQAYAKHRSVLTAHTCLRTRLLAYMTLVRNSALYAAETWPTHHRLLKAANSLQAQHLRGMLHINRRPAEQWAEWHIRSLRAARLDPITHDGARAVVDVHT